MKRFISLATVILIICVSALTTYAGSQSNIVLKDAFEGKKLDSSWVTQTAKDCYVMIDDAGQNGKAMTLVDKNDGTASPNYEGYAAASRTFTPQKGEMVVEFCFNSDKIPMSHERITLGMGKTPAVEMLFNNHGQNAHIRFDDGKKHHLLNGISANLWYRIKLKINVKGNSCEIYLSDMNEPKLNISLANKVEYIDRIIFETGRKLGEKSTFRIDDLLVTGLEKSAEDIAVSDNIIVQQGAYKKINAKVLPYDATDKVIVYSSKNPKVATIDNDGMIYGVSKGTTEIVLKVNGLVKKCKVIVNNDASIKSYVNFDYRVKPGFVNVVGGYELVIEGCTRYGELSPISIVVAEDNGKEVYANQHFGDADGKFAFTVPYINSSEKTLTLEAVFNGKESITKSLNYSPKTVNSELSFDKDVYVTKIGQEDIVNVNLKSLDGRKQIIDVGNAEKRTHVYGDYGVIKCGTVAMNDNGEYYLDNFCEGEYLITANTIEDENESVKTSALVQVNDSNAKIEDSMSESGRTVKVSLDAKTISDKNKNGEKIRLAGGYAEVNLISSSVPNEEISFTVVKKKSPMADVIAEYEISVSDNIKDMFSVVKFPMDFLASKISNYNLISVYGSDDSKAWINLKADLEKETNYMVVKNDKIYPYIQVKVNADKGLNHFSKNDIYSLYSKGIYTDKQIEAPDSYVTSAELANAIKNVFFDSKPINGGKEYITREEAAVAIYNALGFKSNNAADKLGVFKDCGSVDVSCRTALNTLCEYKVFNGDEKSNINPKKNITFGELAVIISRLK